MRGMFFRGVVVGSITAALVVSASAALAGTGVGGIFNLGQSNTVNGTSALKGSSSGPQLSVTNTSTSSGNYGLAVNGASSSPALIARNSASTGSGVYGLTSGGSAVRGQSSTGIGVYGLHSSTSGAAAGVKGVTNSTAGSAYGLFGLLGSSSPGVNSAAIRGQSNGTGYTGYGVWGSQAGSGWGMYGTSATGVGVVGSSANGIASHIPSLDTGVFGAGTYGVDGSGDQVGVLGEGTAEGVFGYGDTYGAEGETVNGDGVYGTTSQDGTGNGVYGIATSGEGVYGASSTGYGTFGSSSTNDGVHGESTSGSAVAGSSGSGDGVYGDSSTGYAAYFVGDVGITGTLSASVKDFRIDDPLDPAHKYLQHTSVESSDMLDIYNGNVTTNAKGYATIRLPNWFEALNRSFRYQLTVIDKAHWTARAAVWNKIAHNRFTIRTDQTHVEVSWQVTGIRHDPYANAYQTKVVLEKPKIDQGKYVNPGVYGKPKSDAIGYRNSKPLKAPKRPRQLASPSGRR